jgi:hypothetical protein
MGIFVTSNFNISFVIEERKKVVENKDKINILSENR